jgi:hypothetical protein
MASSQKVKGAASVEASISWPEEQSRPSSVLVHRLRHFLSHPAGLPKQADGMRERMAARLRLSAMSVLIVGGTIYNFYIFCGLFLLL